MPTQRRVVEQIVVRTPDDLTGEVRNLKKNIQTLKEKAGILGRIVRLDEQIDLRQRTLDGINKTLDRNVDLAEKVISEAQAVAAKMRSELKQESFTIKIATAKECEALREEAKRVTDASEILRKQVEDRENYAAAYEQKLEGWQKSLSQKEETLKNRELELRAREIELLKSQDEWKEKILHSETREQEAEQKMVEVQRQKEMIRIADEHLVEIRMDLDRRKQEVLVLLKECEEKKKALKERGQRIAAREQELGQRSRELDATALALSERSGKINQALTRTRQMEEKLIAREQRCLEIETKIAEDEIRVEAVRGNVRREMAELRRERESTDAVGS